MCHRRYYRDRVEYRSEEPTQTLVGAPEGPVRAGLGRNCPDKNVGIPGDPFDRTC